MAVNTTAHASPETDTISADHAEFEKLSSVGRPFCFVDSFRKDGQGKPLGKIGLRLVSSQDEILAAVNAHKYAKNAVKEESGLAYEEVYRVAFSFEVLYVACFLEDRYQQDGSFRPFFRTVDLARKELSQDEREYLLNGYLSLRATKGALRETFDGEDLMFWAFMLTEDPIQAAANLSHSAIMALLQALSKLLLDTE